MAYNFDTRLDRTKLHTMKWEYEQDRKKNPNMICLGTAEMDFKAAPPILEAFQQVVDNGHFGYPYKRDAYYEAVINWFERHCDLELKREWMANSVAIYPSFQGLIEAFSAEGDEVVFQTPVHFIFSDIVSSLKRVPVVNPLKIENGRYEMNLEDLKQKITPKTKLLLLCNPHNPVGRAWTKEELTALMEICLANHIIVISDEVYFSLIFPGKQYTPLASISEEAAMNSVTCISTSKGFNLTGVKHSLVIAKNPALLNAYKAELHKNNEFFGESIFGHAAVEAAFSKCDDWSAELMEYLQGNFEALKQFTAEKMPAVKVYEPDGTYFVWLDFNCLGMNKENLTAFFEDEAEVEVTLGFGLGQGGAGYARINMATQRDLLMEGMERLAKVYAKHMQG